MRETWTDERLDDLAETLRPLPAQVARVEEGLGRLTAAVDGHHAELTVLRQDFNALQRQIVQIGWGLAGGLFASMIGLIVTNA